MIPDLISLGVDVLHPLQAKAVNMEAERLGSEFRGALGPDLVVSPSHEALFPNVPPTNVLAMARTAAELGACATTAISGCTTSTAESSTSVGAS